MKIEIPLLCRSKKNSQEIRYNRRTGKPFVSQSELYKQFEKDCAYFMPKLKEPINKPVNLKCTFIVPDRRKRDLTNLENAIADILVKYRVLEDDNYNILAGWDGSRIIYQKGVEKTIIEIEEGSIDEKEHK
jgi:Holliday junction resolvase RusA-like endonuclease